MRDEYGDVSSHDVDGDLVVLVDRAELAREVLHDRYANFVKAGTPDQQMLSPLLGNGLLTADGADWERQRRLCAPAFRPALVDTFDTVITDSAGSMLQRWAAGPQAGAQSGDAVRIDHDLTALTLTVVMRAMFGYDLTGIGSGFGDAVDKVNRHMGHYRGDGPPSAEQLRDREQFNQARGYLDGVVRMVIAALRMNGAEQDNLLTQILSSSGAQGHEVTDRELRDQVLTIVMAGHETTAKALTWTLFLLAGHPGARDAVLAEIDGVLGGRVPTAADAASMVHCRAALEESLRLYPPVWLISRRSLEATTLGGYDVPAGALVCVSPYMLHRNPTYWADPECYQPARFLPDAPERPSHAYLPFGGGPRLCIGRYFALTEAVLVLAMILQSTDLQLSTDQVVEPEALVTLRPRHGLYGVPRPRR